MNQLLNYLDVITGEKNATTLNPMTAPYAHNGESNEFKIEEETEEEISRISNDAKNNKNEEEE